MNNDALFNIDDLVDNPTARVPICLCLDVSSSMEGVPIQELNKGVQLFYQAIREDDIALYAAEVCIVTFGGINAECVCDFSSLQNIIQPPKLSAHGMTPMGEAVNMGLDLLEKRKNEYKNKGIDYFQPWLVLMTDGEPNGEPQELSRAIQRTVELARKGKLSVFPIGIGEDVNMDILRQFSPKRPPLKLQGLKFCQFFEWLSQSVSRTSQSTPGEKIPLDIEGIKAWSEL